MDLALKTERSFCSKGLECPGRSKALKGDGSCPNIHVDKSERDAQLGREEEKRLTAAKAVPKEKAKAKAKAKQ